jgi:hypothetical protein
LMSKIQSLLAGPVTPQRLWEIMWTVYLGRWKHNLRIFFKKISSVLTPNFHPTQALRRVEEQWRTCSDCLSLFYSSGTRELPSRTSFLLGSWSKAKHWNSRNPKGVNNRSCLEVPKRWNMCSAI